MRNVKPHHLTFKLKQVIDLSQHSSEKYSFIAKIPTGNVLYFYIMMKIILRPVCFSSHSFTFAILYLFDIYVCHNLILSVNTFPVTIFGLHRFFMHIYVSPLIILLLVEACKCQEIETGAFIKFQLHQFEVWKSIFMELIQIHHYI